MRPLTFVPVLLSLTTSAFAGHVLVVGSGPGQLPEIQAAVDAAVDGDVILVKSGTYSSFVVVSKQLSIVADVGQSVNVDGAIRARGLRSGRTLVLAGLHATGHLTSNAVEGDGLYLLNCAGFVRVQDCTLQGFQGGAACGTIPRHGAEIENSAAVSFERCTLLGARADEVGTSPYDAIPEGHGLVATNSSVALDTCTVTGGSGGFVCDGYPDGTNGGDGCSLTSSFLFAAKSNISGGRGTDVTAQLAESGSGGDGIRALDASCVVHLLDSLVQAGVFGTSSNCGLCGSCCNGMNGSQYTMAPGATLDLMTGTARSLAAASVARESTLLALTVVGVAGDVVALRTDPNAAFAFDPARFGTGLVAAPVPARFLILGTISNTGTLNATLPMPSIPFSDPGRTLCLQTLHTDVNGISRLGSPLSLVVLDSAY